MFNHSLKSRSNLWSTCLGIATLMALSGSANVGQAALRGFEAEDGYVDVGHDPSFDIGQYNAGLNPGANWTANQYTVYPQGTNNPDGLGWKKLPGSPAMPHFSTAAGNVYATSHQENNFQNVHPRTGQRALLITTNNLGWLEAPQQYSYQVDSNDLMDLDGMPVEPSMTENTSVTIEFWACAQLLGLGETSGAIPSIQGGLPAGSTGNSISFVDSLGQAGVKVGYIQPGTTTDYFAFDVGNGMMDTGIEVDPAKWHRWEVMLDLESDLATIAIQPSETENTVTVLNSQPMGPMSGFFKEMLFSSTGGPDNTQPVAVAGKLWTLDDFSMTVVPEPSTGILTLATMMILGFRRRS